MMSVRRTAAVLALVACAAGAARGEGGEPVRVAVGFAEDAPEPAVGTKLPVVILVHNASDRPWKVLDWAKNPKALEPHVFIAPAPVAPKQEPLPELARNQWVASSDDWFRDLPPGDTRLSIDVVPMLAGWLHVAATLQSTTALVVDENGPTRRLDGVWLGRTTGQVRVHVPDEVPPERAKRYEAARRALLDASKPDEVRREVLDAVAAERHLFAARFLRDVYPALPPGPLQNAALAHLVALAKFGTGYEAVPVLLVAAGRPTAPGDVRLAILEFLRTLLGARGRQTLAGQMAYTHPEPLLDQARGTIRRLVTDPDAAVAARARKIVERWERDGN